MLIKNAKVMNADFNYEETDILFDTHIKQIAVGIVSKNEAIIEASGCKVIPSFFDIHTHGAVGQEAMELSDFKVLQNYLYKNGVLNFYLTTLSANQEETTKQLKQLGTLDSVEGINLEGPYLSHQKAGVHKKEALKKAEMAEFELFQKAANNKIKIITIAPETKENIEFIKDISKNKVAVSLGHSNCSYEQAAAAFAGGATQVTHLFNAMSPINHRSPGLIPAAFDYGAYCEVICDGVHLHPSIVRMIYRQIGPDKMILISDSMAAAGLADGEYSLGGVDVRVENKVARTKNGVIAGSTHNLREMVKMVISFGIPEEDAVKMATLTPAKSQRRDSETGSLLKGKYADLLIIDDDFNILKAFKKGNMLSV